MKKEVMIESNEIDGAYISFANLEKMGETIRKYPYMASVHAPYNVVPGPAKISENKLVTEFVKYQEDAKYREELIHTTIPPKGFPLSQVILQAGGLPREFYYIKVVAQGHLGSGSYIEIPEQVTIMFDLIKYTHLDMLFDIHTERIVFMPVMKNDPMEAEVRSPIMKDFSEDGGVRIAPMRIKNLDAVIPVIDFFKNSSTHLPPHKILEARAKISYPQLAVLFSEPEIKKDKFRKTITYYILVNKHEHGLELKPYQDIKYEPPTELYVNRGRYKMLAARNRKQVYLRGRKLVKKEYKPNQAEDLDFAGKLPDDPYHYFNTTFFSHESRRFYQSLFPGFDSADSLVPYAGISNEELQFLLRGGMQWCVIYVPFMAQKMLTHKNTHNSGSVWFSTVEMAPDIDLFKGEYFLIHTIPWSHYNKKKTFNFRIMNAKNLETFYDNNLLNNKKFLNFSEKHHPYGMIGIPSKRGSTHFQIYETWQIADDLVKIYNGGSTRAGFITTYGARLVLMPNISTAQLKKHPYPYFELLYKDLKERFDNHAKIFNTQDTNGLVYFQKKKIELAPEVIFQHQRHAGFRFSKTSGPSNPKYIRRRR